MDVSTNPFVGMAHDPLVPDALQSDSELLAFVRAGEIRAFDILYLRHYTVVWKFAYRFVGSRDDAQDLAQDVFVSFWERRSTLDITTGVRTYLLAAVRLRALDALRHRYVMAQLNGERIHPPVISATPASPEELTDDALLQDRIRRRLAQLPERQRSAILLRWEQGLGNQEIAQVLGIGKAATSRLLSRAVETLRSAVMSEGDTDGGTDGSAYGSEDRGTGTKRQM